jgi:chemotaxis protein methyltransferase CheR
MTALSPQQLAVVSDLVGRWTGLHFPEDRFTELERGIQRAAKDFGHRSADQFVSSMMAAELSTEQIKTLAWHLTIGETYFLRGKSTFEVLEKDILPEMLMQRRGKEQQLRLWSAGCSGGEEPYSLAITVSRLLPNVADWNTTILATDINTRALHKALDGVYGSWSFRDTPDWLRAQFFSSAANGDWSIRPQVKRMVRFSYLNLAVDPYPSLATNTNAMDVIFCRNVIMYFGADVMMRVIGQLYDSLRDGGYLFVAPSEASQELFPQFRRRSERGEIFYQKDIAWLDEQRSARTTARGTVATQPRRAPSHAPPLAAARPGTIRPASATRPAAPSSPRPARPPAPRTPAPEVTPAQPVAVPAGDAAVLAAAARAAANEGRLSEALGLVEEAIAHDKVDAGYHYLHATILEELARSDDAVKALTSALFLDPGMPLAYFLNGNIARRQGRAAEAKKHFRKTLSALEKLEPDDVLPESEGMTAGKLAEIVESLLEMEVDR